MATKKEIEQQLKVVSGGAVFIRPGQIAKAMGVSRSDKVRHIYAGLPHPAGSASYFIPDVAESIWSKMKYGSEEE